MPAPLSRIGSVIKSITIGIFTIITVLSMCGVAHASATDRFHYRTDDTLLIFNLSLARHTVHDGILAYQYEEGILVPFSEIMDALNLPITIGQDMQRAEGWFLSEERRFILDLSQQTVTVNHKTESYNPSWVELHEDDIYVNSLIFSEWFPFEIEVELSNLVLIVNTREKLPLEKKIERKQRWKTLEKSSQQIETWQPKMDVPYLWASWPFINHNLSYGINQKADGRRKETMRYTAMAVGDFLKHTAEFSTNLNHSDGETEVNDARIKFGRLVSEPTHPLAITEYSFGDIDGFAVKLASRESSGVGIKLSNYPLNFDSEFDNTTLSGDALEDWDVELYQNGYLIDYQTIDSDNRYQFDDVPLLYGMNLYEIIFYGPQGQKHEKVIRKNVGAEMIRKGAQHYQFSTLQKEQTLIPNKPQDDVPKKMPQHVLNYRAGISDKINLSLGLSHTPLVTGVDQTEPTLFTRMALHTFHDQFLTSLEAVSKNSGGHGIQANAQGKLSSLNLFTSHGYFENYYSEQEGSYNKKTRYRGELRLNGRKKIEHYPSLTYRLSSYYIHYSDDEVENKYTASLSSNIERVSLTNNFTYTKNSTGNENLSGNFLLNTRKWAAWSLNGSAAYQLSHEKKINTLNLSANKSFSSQYGVNASIRRNMTNNTHTSFQMGFSHQLKYARYQISLSHDSDDNIALKFSLSSSSSRNPANGHWSFDSTPNTNYGGAVSRIYLDNNLNNRYDSEDEIIQNARIKLNGQPKRSNAQDKVYLFVNDVPTHQKINMSVDLSSLEDPYWIPSTEGVSFTLRPGRVIAYDIPIYTGGEIDGTVRLKEKGETRPVSKVKLEIINHEGVVIQNAETAYDGFYLFTQIPPGEYRLRINEKQQKRLKLQAKEESVTIGGDGTLLSGMDFELTLEKDP